MLRADEPGGKTDTGPAQRNLINFKKIKHPT